MQTKEVKLLYGGLIAAQIFYLVRTFLWHPNIADSYHYSIAIAGYVLWGFLADFFLLVLAITTQKLFHIRKLAFTGIIIVLILWGLLFILASAAV